METCTHHQNITITSPVVLFLETLKGRVVISQSLNIYPKLSLEQSVGLTVGEMEHQHTNASRSLISPPTPAQTMLYTGVAIASVYGVIIVLGLVGNITLIKTFCSAKSVRNVPNLFMSSLALGDVLLLVTCAPVDASRYLSEEWLFGRLGCKVIPFIQLTSVGVSVFTLTALSADR